MYKIDRRWAGGSKNRILGQTPHLTWLQHGHDWKSSFIELSIKNKYQAFFGASRIISDKFFNYFSFLT